MKVKVPKEEDEDRPRIEEMNEHPHLKTKRRLYRGFKRVSVHHHFLIGTF